MHSEGVQIDERVGREEVLRSRPKFKGIWIRLAGNATGGYGQRCQWTNQVVCEIVIQNGRVWKEMFYVETLQSGRMPGFCQNYKYMVVRVGMQNIQLLHDEIGG